jgi:hypothetical protein
VLAGVRDGELVGGGHRDYPRYHRQVEVGVGRAAQPPWVLGRGDDLAGRLGASGEVEVPAQRMRVAAAVIARAQRVMLPVDHTKIGIADFARVCAPDEIDILVTDENHDHLRKLCEAQGVRLVVATSRSG